MTILNENLGRFILKGKLITSQASLEINSSQTLIRKLFCFRIKTPERLYILKKKKKKLRERERRIKRLKRKGQIISNVHVFSTGAFHSAKDKQLRYNGNKARKKREEERKKRGGGEKKMDGTFQATAEFQDSHIIQKAVNMALRCI